MKISQGGGQPDKKYDSFPFVVVMLNIITKSLDLLTSRMHLFNNLNQKMYYKTFPKYKELFNKTCQEIFFGNAWHTLNEFIHHNIIIFCYIWKNGFLNLENYFSKECATARKKVNKSGKKEVFLYLYYSLFTTPIRPKSFNRCNLQEYKNIFDLAFNFTINNFLKLAQIT